MQPAKQFAFEHEQFNHRSKKETHMKQKMKVLDLQVLNSINGGTKPLQSWSSYSEGCGSVSADEWSTVSKGCR